MLKTGYYPLIITGITDLVHCRAKTVFGNDTAYLSETDIIV